MKTKRYYQVRLGVRVAFWLSLAAGIMYITNHVNWMGDHYCFKSMNECYFGGK